MNTAYLILGGNLGDKAENLRRASEMIQTHVGSITKKSKMYVTAAWGKEDQPDFYNVAICVKTKFGPHELLSCLLSIEEKLGRKRDGSKWNERVIDIDILFFNDEVIGDVHLKVPHPHLQERKFVLVPLAEIAAEFRHPQLNKSVAELLQQCNDQLKVSSI